MCEPTTIALVAVAASSALAAYSSKTQGDAAQSQANYQSAVSRNNAILAQRAAADAIDRGNQSAALKAVQGKQFLARERATLASNGSDVNSGSALDITSDTAGNNAYDELVTRNNAQREAVADQTQAGNFTGQAAADQIAGQNAESAGNLGAASNVLAGAGSVATKWYQFNQAGAGQNPINNGSFSSGSVNGNGF